MRLIDADELKKKVYPLPFAIGVEYAVTLRDINEAQIIDAVPMAFHERCMGMIIKERNQLLKDLHFEIQKHGSCEFCKHKNKSAAECKDCTHDNDHWEWRGVVNCEKDEQK